MHRTRLAILFGFLLLPSTSTAQSPRHTRDEQSTWFAYTGIHPISARWRLQLEGQVRQTERASQPQQRLFRTALLRVLTPTTRAGAGFAATRTFPSDEFVANPTPFGERRAYEQLDLRQIAGPLVIDHRYRLEQRWVERLATTPTGASEHDGWTYTNRARYFLRTIVAPGGGAPQNGETYFVGYDEVFVNFGQNVRANVFDQNRLFAGVGHRFGSVLGVEVGYLNQLVLRSNGTDVERNHTILIGIQSEAPFKR